MLKKRASHKCVNTMTDCGSHIQVCLHSQICLFFKLGNGAMKNWGERCPCLWWPCFGVSCGGSSCVWDCLQDPIQVVLVRSLPCTLSSSVVSNSLRPHELQPSRLLCPWNFPGKNTEMGCHFLLQGIFPTQESNPPLLDLLPWQEDSLPLSHWGSPGIITDTCAYQQGQQCCYQNALQCYFGEGDGTPLQYSCLANPMDGGTW